jgi:hypothetical protein
MTTIKLAAIQRNSEEKNMYYLVTDQKDQSWRSVQWGPNTSHEEANPNFHFGLYNSLSIAQFMYPYHEDIAEPKFWKATATIAPSNHYYNTASKVTTIEPISVALPTNQQRINFAILACSHIVSNPIFREWAKAFLLGQSTDDASKVGQRIQESLFTSKNRQDDYTSCVHACLNASMVENPAFFAAAAAYRAFTDSPQEDPISLSQIADICLAVQAKDIATMILN